MLRRVTLRRSDLVRSLHGELVAVGAVSPASTATGDSPAAEAAVDAWLTRDDSPVRDLLRADLVSTGDILRRLTVIYGPGSATCSLAVLIAKYLVDDRVQAELWGAA